MNDATVDIIEQLSVSCMFSFLLDKYLQVEFLGHRVTPYLPPGPLTLTFSDPGTADGETMWG